MSSYVPSRGLAHLPAIQYRPSFRFPSGTMADAQASSKSDGGGGSSSSTAHPPPEDDELEHEHDDHQQGPARKRQRVRLSCLECRRRKLSCSRELPCDRCIKSGTPERCSYEARPGSMTIPAGDRAPFAPPGAPVTYGAEIRRPAANPPSTRREVDLPVSRDVARDQERLRRLELEVTQLKNTLSKQASIDGSTIVASPATLKDSVRDGHSVRSNPAFTPRENPEVSEFQNLRGHDFKTKYVGPHNAWSSLQELTGIYHFMRETAEEWLQPLNIQKKDRGRRKEEREKKFREPDLLLESLLPPKEETDSLVAVYLDQFEQIHRIIHVPTFKAEYEAFWDPAKTKNAAFTALLLSMISVSCSLDMQASSKFVGVKSSSIQMAERCVRACDEWHQRQSQKHRKLVHYQISCLLYLAKRVNIVKKKRFWTTSGAMIRDGITVGLHQDPDHVTAQISPYFAEMRRRLWATMVEFDVQAAFDQGHPTLLGAVHNDVDAPKNIDDDSFDENSQHLPISRPANEYTCSSYQHISRRSLSLRLELTKLLTGPPTDLEWEQVLQYSDMITHEIDQLPSWDSDTGRNGEYSQKPILASTLLHIQLRQYLIPLHQPYLKLRKFNSKYQVAELIYYTAARDIVMMHDCLYQKGIRTLYFLREDTMNSVINLCNVTLHQPKDSTSLIMSNAHETLKLVEKCIAMKEDRVLRCGNNDPWGYSSMCAAFGLLETHMGIKTSEAAKAAAAERFISLHYKLLAFQIPPYHNQQPQSHADTPQTVVDPVSRAKSITPFPLDPTPAVPMATTPYQRDGMPISMPWTIPPSSDSGAIPVSNPDFNFDMLGSDVTDLWGDWTGTEFT
ncbi:fungal-specific transcription factor domain-containing protein [Durotheca rogersii]|uniref:fungal-specific transcription factor domain-containing protein n=1 Tax=Durotheca rogersii TaxID=419775 RepID=UPI00222059FE|nr:fungal-specific transcription factor domain-containing protein [Durotheca rogersii]KAI5862280.1 fungal-specific transcription factor domain-containing protein [Durotheca rogersii]